MRPWLQGTQTFYAEHADDGFIVFTVLKATSLEETAAWADAYGLTFPVLYDAESVGYDLYRDGVGHPQFIVVDRELTVQYRGRGTDGHDEAEAVIETLLAE